MPYLSIKKLDRVILKTFTRYQKRRLFQFYNHPFYTRIRTNNLFLNTLLPEPTATTIRLSAGQLPDYSKRKKKKKTYMAGFETTYLLSQQLQASRIKTITLFLKGHGAQKKGIFLALMRQRLFPTVITDVTPVAHNGTRAYRRRRL